MDPQRWVKIESLDSNSLGEIPFGVLEMRIDFYPGDEERLFAQVMGSLRLVGVENTNATLNAQLSTLNLEPIERILLPFNVER